ncbi:MAG: phosphoglucosamine mutase [Candidatus Thorarchaeota archaeon]|jgi:phosphoglucosamine mutase
MTDRLFGTTGVRKVYGEEFNLEMALKLGKALGTYIQKGSVAIARDVRTTSKMIEDSLVAGVLSTGVNVVRAGMIPTPTLAFITKQRGFEAGLMVTASHNPPEYTGVKFWDNDGMGYTPDMEARLERIYESGEFNVAPWDSLGSECVLETAVDEHIDSILAQCDAELIRTKQFSIVVDPGNGAASVMTPYLMGRLACKVISINSQPDGHFPGRPSEPDEESLGDTINFVQDVGADLGVAHDGDSDRVVFVTESGEVVRGDRTIALLARDILNDSESKTIVTTVDSSLVLDETVLEAGGTTLRTPVGDIRVAMEMKESSAVFGGEACGVFIFSDFIHAPEPFLTTCKVLELMAKTGRSFGSLISDIPVYPLRKAKLECPNEKKEAVMQTLADALPVAMPDTVGVLTVDGLGITMKEGWALVRPSGTEPVIRITCEARSAEAVEGILEEAQSVVESAIKSAGR